MSYILIKILTKFSWKENIQTKLLVKSIINVHLKINAGG